MDYNGERFLDVLYKELYKSNEVLRTKQKNDTKEESIRRYLYRLDRIHTKANFNDRKELIKKLYYAKYVIKKENLPYYLSDNEIEGIIDSQKKVLSNWIDYLTDENTMYPNWAKYWVFQQMLKIGTYDEISGKFTKRDKKTINPFIDVNPEIIAKCIDSATNLLSDKKLSAQQIRKIISDISFEKLYIKYQNSYKKRHKSNDGIWIKYHQGNEEEAKKLSASLEGKNTGWCTTGKSTAIAQVCGGSGYSGGDFYVYYTLDENNEYSVPRIAIRLDGHTNIGEIRGITEHQNLEEEMIPILESKLNAMDFLSKEDVEKNLATINELKKLLLIKNKAINKENLTVPEIIDLYTKNFGFGWEQDPLVSKIIQLRDIGADYKLLKNEDLNVKVSFILKNYYKFNQLKENRFIDELEVVKKITKTNASLLNYVDETILLDKHNVLSIVKENGKAIEYLSDELKTDKDVILEASKIYTEAMKYASNELKNDKEYILRIVENNGAAFKFIDTDLKNDIDVCITALKTSTSIIKDVPQEFLQDRSFILEIVKNNGRILFRLDKKYMEDREIVLTAVKNEGSIYQALSGELRNDKEIFLEACKTSYSALMGIEEGSLTDKDLVIALLGIHSTSINLASEELRNDPDVMLVAIKNYSGAIQYASEDLLKNKEFVLQALKQNAWIYKYISEKYADDKEVVLEAVRNDGFMFEYASDTLKDDRDFVFKVVKIDGYAYAYASKRLQLDPQIALEAIKSTQGLVLSEMVHFTEIENYKDIFNISISLMKSEIIKVMDEYTDKDKFMVDINEGQQMMTEVIKEDDEAIEQLNRMFDDIKIIVEDKFGHKK